MSILQRVVSVVWAAVLALVILAVGQLSWGALLFTNLRVSPRIPWFAAAMAVVLWVMWQYLGGRWWPGSTAEARRRCLRASSVSSRTFTWALVAGVFSIAALSGLWIVLFQVSRTPANALADVSNYPLLTIIATVLMASLVSPFTEEAAFRGYAMSILERNLRAPTAIVISSVMFAAAHLNWGFYWTKLSVYFLVGLAFAVIAHLANSIWPSIVVHVMADLTFFVLVWPHDATRRLVTEGGADTWFWIHVAQVVVCAPVAIWCLRQLARPTEAPASRTMPVPAAG
jgi:membrane protease YdiL (CAAX protease family)